MKKLNNITAIIIFIVIAFCSCTSSGKLSDAKFPYYTGSLTVPTSVGSYAITVTPRMPCIECEFAKMHLQVVCIGAAIIGLCYVGIFIHNLIKKPKTIKP